MVKNYFAKWSSSKLDQDESSRVLRFYVVCWSLESRSIRRATKLKDVWNEHGFVEHFVLAAREVQFIWHVVPGVSTIEIAKMCLEYLNGQNPESFDERIMFMSLFNYIGWTNGFGWAWPWSPERQQLFLWACICHSAIPLLSGGRSDPLGFWREVGLPAPHCWPTMSHASKKKKDIGLTKKGNTETCLHNAKDVAAFATQFEPGQWCFLERASEIRGGT